MTKQDFLKERKGLSLIISDLKQNRLNLDRRYVNALCEFKEGERVLLVYKFLNGEEKHCFGYIKRITTDQFGEFYYSFVRPKKNGLPSQVTLRFNYNKIEKTKQYQI